MEGSKSEPLPSAGPGKVVSHRRAARLNVAIARSSSSAREVRVRGRGQSGDEGSMAMVEAVEAPVVPPVPRRFDSSIVDAVASDDRALVFSLYDQGISLDSTNRGGLTVLIAAVNWNRDDIVEFCLSHNCNIDAKGNVSQLPFRFHIVLSSFTGDHVVLTVPILVSRTDVQPFILQLFGEERTWFEC
jgi:hypothetical protein